MLSIEENQEGVIDIYQFSEGGGPVVRCHKDGRIELYGVPQYGGDERFVGYFPTIQAALEVGRTWT